jgi:RNA-directed DNA polymerase
LKAFFDSVNQDRLLNALRQKIGSGKLLRLIGRHLRAGVELPEGTREATPQGVPQGGPLPPLSANIVLDPLDKEIERRVHPHVRYADDFVILVNGAMKAQRVMESVARFVEGKPKLTVNRTKSKSGPLAQSSFLGFQINSRGGIQWTAKACERFKQRVKEITRRNRGHALQDVIDELRRYATGWMNCFGISQTCREVLELDAWIRRRVRLHHWKQWSRPKGDSQPTGCPAGVERSGSNRPRARRRNLLKLGADPKEVHMATRSRKGCWRMSANSIAQRALNNRWLKERGVPELRSIWIKPHYGEAVKVNP